MFATFFSKSTTLAARFFGFGSGGLMAPNTWFIASAYFFISLSFEYHVFESVGPDLGPTLMIWTSYLKLALSGKFGWRRFAILPDSRGHG